MPVQPLVFLTKDGKVARYNLRKVIVNTMNIHAVKQILTEQFSVW